MGDSPPQRRRRTDFVDLSDYLTSLEPRAELSPLVVADPQSHVRLSGSEDHRIVAVALLLLERISTAIKDLGSK